MSHRGVTNKRIHAAPDVDLDERQRYLVGVILDLFQAKYTWGRLQNFTEDAVYLDAFADAKGREQISGQMAGLPIVTQSSITKEHLVIRATPSEIHFRMKHTFHFAKAFLLGQSVTFSTVVIIETKDGQITKWSDRPEDDLPSDAVTKAMRDINSIVAPKFLPLPTSDEEDAEWWAKHVAPRKEQQEREAEQGGPEGRPAEEPTKRG